MASRCLPLPPELVLAVVPQPESYQSHGLPLPPVASSCLLSLSQQWFPSPKVTKSIASHCSLRRYFLFGVYASIIFEELKRQKTAARFGFRSARVLFLKNRDLEIFDELKNQKNGWSFWFPLRQVFFGPFMLFGFQSLRSASF